MSAILQAQPETEGALQSKVSEMNRNTTVPVSICLVTYNRASVLPMSLDSLLGQTFGDFELIVSDDCSTDETRDICLEFSSRDSRIKYFRNSKNLGMPGNLNAAIKRAQGNYIANLHDGDIFRSDLIEKWKRALDSIPEAPFVFNAYETMEPDRSRKLWQEPFGFRVPGELIAQHYFRTVSCCVWGTVMARASAYARVGLFDPDFGFISDVDMWLRLAYGATVAYIGEPLITLRKREPNHPWNHNVWQPLFWDFAIYARHLPKYIGQVSIYDRSWYYETFRRRAIRGMLWLVKHKRWDRVQEGLAMWRDADDRVLRVIGRILGQSSWCPDWYDSRWWTRIRFPEVDSEPQYVPAAVERDR